MRLSARAVILCFFEQTLYQLNKRSRIFVRKNGRDNRFAAVTVTRYQIEPVLISKCRLRRSGPLSAKLNVILQPDPFQVFFLTSCWLNASIDRVGIGQRDQIDAG